ncbi:type IV pilus modification PilV family protein [Hydrocarboniphaga sp.]|uniref:type IV pilus modification PilV family protein n=1 Tax=Hydrocarboniphaga sp. TaxID=2033016 RepID=UPI003D11D7D6
MRPSRSTDRGAAARSQRGDALLEALVGVLLVAVIGMGSAYTASRVAVTHKYARTQAMAISQLRQMLQNASDIASWCAGSSPPAVRIRPEDSSLATIDLPVTVSCTAAGTLTVGGKTISAAPSRVTLSVTSAATFGGAGSIVVGNISGG